MCAFEDYEFWLFRIDGWDFGILASYDDVGTGLAGHDIGGAHFICAMAHLAEFDIFGDTDGIEDCDAGFEI